MDTPWPWLPYLAIFFVPWFYSAPSPTDAGIAASLLPLFFVAYIGGYGASGARSTLAVAALFVVTIVGHLVSPTSGVFTVYAAAIAGRAVMPTRRALALIAAVAVFALAHATLTGTLPLFWIPTVLFVVLIGASTLFTRQLAETNAALTASQDEVAHYAAIAERERISRDLHDLLGHTLTVVAVKADLAERLLPEGCDKARAEVQDIRQLVRDALRETRAAVAGVRTASLNSELDRARRALATVDISIDVVHEAEDIRPDVDEAFAMVVREAVTNVVRHSDATTCTIRVVSTPTSWRLSVKDDGRGQVGAIEGTGVAGMKARIDALDGELSWSSHRGRTEAWSAGADAGRTEAWSAGADAGRSAGADAGVHVLAEVLKERRS